MHLKLQCTNRMGNPLEIIRLPMRKIVHGIYIPLRTRTMVRVFYNPIHNRGRACAYRRSHIDFRPQYHRTFFKFALIHALEQIEIFFYGTIAIRATYSGLCRCSLLLGDLFPKSAHLHKHIPPLSYAMPNHTTSGNNPMHNKDDLPSQSPASEYLP